MVRNPAFSDRAKKERFELFIFLQQRIKKILSFFKNKIIISSFDIVSKTLSIFKNKTKYIYRKKFNNWSCGKIKNIFLNRNTFLKKLPFKMQIV